MWRCRADADATIETVSDIRGNVVEVIDPAGRTAVTQTFDLADRKLRNASIDAGDSMAVFDLPVDDDTHPDDSDLGKEILPQFNRAGALQAIEMTGTGTTPSVSHIAYNARGQRVLAALGNGVMTRYAYDAKTFRLARQRSETCTETSGTYSSAGSKYQDITYAYDGVGNILQTDERVEEIGVGGQGNRKVANIRIVMRRSRGASLR